MVSFTSSVTLRLVAAYVHATSCFETIPMRVLTTQSPPAHAGTLFLPMRISIFVELIVQKLIIRGKKTNKRRELHLGRNAYFSVCHNIWSIGPSWDFDFMYS